MTLQNFTLGTFSQGAAGGGGAFESIASASGTGSSLTITLSSIPSTYQHLQLRVFALKTSTNSEDLRLRFNGDTGSNYVWHQLAGYNSAAVVRTGTAQTYMFIANNSPSLADMSTTSGTVAIVDIHDYASTTKNKTMRSFGGIDQNVTANSEVGLISGLWLNTAAINSITVFMPNTGSNFTTTTSVALYGIKGA